MRIVLSDAWRLLWVLVWGPGMALGSRALMTLAVLSVPATVPSAMLGWQVPIRSTTAAGGSASTTLRRRASNTLTVPLALVLTGGP